MSSDDSSLHCYRKQGAPHSAVLFVHGFTGSAEQTWGGFPELLCQDPEVNYDIYCWGYPSQLRLAYLLTRPFWTDDPNLDTLGQGLRTLLDHALQNYQKLVLIGHSMGGLVIQSFILEELLADKSHRLGRVTEVILFGTPSGGLVRATLAAYLKNQIADMDKYGPFVQRLRREWSQFIDERRSDPLPGVNFRLTLVAGLKDTFVPQESSLDPFPLDEKEIVPGNHTEMVKPATVNDLAYRVLKQRLLRGTPSGEELALIYGGSEEAVQYLSRIEAAKDLADVGELEDIAATLLQQQPSRMPRVERALGLALLGYERYDQASSLLTRYLDFKMPGTGAQPFRADAQAVQQLAIALSGADDMTGALTHLNDLDPQIRNASETLGIYAGRMKRQWLKMPSNLRLGHNALNRYQAAFNAANAEHDQDQMIYNGINVAFMRFALGEANYRETATAILNLCNTTLRSDYWTVATRAEACLLLGDYPQARQALEAAMGHAPPPRFMATTGQQALEILKRQGEPPESKEITTFLRNYFLSSGDISNPQGSNQTL